MKQYFAAGDKVVQKNTQKPIMVIVGQTMQGGFPTYTPIEDTYTCQWLESGSPQRKSFHESKLKRHYDDEILALIAACREILMEKESDASTNQLSLIQNRRNELIAFEGQYLQKDESPFHQAQIHLEFKEGILKIKEQILTI